MLPNHHFILATPLAEHGIDPHHDTVVRYMAALHRGHGAHSPDRASDPSDHAATHERHFGRLMTHVIHRRPDDDRTPTHAHAA